MGEPWVTVSFLIVFLTYTNAHILYRSRAYHSGRRAAWRVESPCQRSPTVAPEDAEDHLWRAAKLWRYVVRTYRLLWAISSAKRIILSRTIYGYTNERDSYRVYEELFFSRFCHNNINWVLYVYNAVDTVVHQPRHQLQTVKKGPLLSFFATSY